MTNCLSAVLNGLVSEFDCPLSLAILEVIGWLGLATHSLNTWSPQMNCLCSYLILGKSHNYTSDLSEGGPDNWTAVGKECSWHTPVAPAKS